MHPYDSHTTPKMVTNPLKRLPTREIWSPKMTKTWLYLQYFAKFRLKPQSNETATHIGIREAEDWFRPIDLAKECDIYISSKNGSRKEIPIACGYTEDPFKNRPQNFKPKIRDNYPQYLERQNKNCYICGDSSHYARDCEKRFKPKKNLTATSITEKTRIL
ncbi:hypothetical protein TNCV_1833221 [Trichonephila clavipes]|nr:hypothetical protein TNCV_1833221 [Trichonephila clavipes]